MANLALARALEALGIRRFYKLITRIGADHMISDAETPPYHKIKLKELRDDARYFLWANFFRGILYVPVIIVLWPMGVPFVTGSLVFLVAFHGVCIALELYKATLMEFWLAQLPDLEPGQKPKETGPTDVDPHWYFDGKFFESIRGYQLIGMEKFRQLVVAYTNKTKFSKEELKAGKRVNYLQSGSLQSVVKYEHDTRVGEIMHMAALAFNVSPFAALMAAASWGWGAFVGLILWLDLYLVLLQRYNRIRVHKILAKVRKGRATQSTPATQGPSA